VWGCGVGAAQNEKAKQQFHELVLKISDVCFDKCVPSPGSKLSSSETSCSENCALRFMEATQLLNQRLMNSNGR